MIRLGLPAAMLLAVPAVAVLWRLARGHGRATAAVRVTIIALLIAALADVQFNLAGRGVDVVLVVDRSDSINPQQRREIDELIGSAMADRRERDRVGVVAFGRSARLQRRLSEEAAYIGDTAPVAADGSDLAGGLETALAILDNQRPSRVVVLSDGQATGTDGLAQARRAAARQVPIDYRLFEQPRQGGGDIAVESLTLPTRIDRNEPFQFSAVVHSDRETEVTFQLARPGREPVVGRKKLTAGVNRWLFRDVIDGRGVVDYRLSVQADGGSDRPENNTARGVVHVQAPPAILLVNNAGSPGNLVRAMAVGKLDVDVVSAGAADLTAERLAGYRAVVLENVAAADLGPGALASLRTFVLDAGGGLMMTGGQRSFGRGGYYASELDDAADPVLPVSLELRKEHRKLSVAMAIVLDRSGSMTMPVAGGKTKMDLANLGAAEAIRLLGDMDAVSVIAVDSQAHIIVPLTRAADKAALAGRVLKIESLGGGIFVYTGLLAAGKQLEHASQAGRHVILFADAQDAEEPGDYKALLERFAKLGITVSAIGLGKSTDCDAEFLRDVARRGGGQAFFTDDATRIPQLFKQDTASFAADTFIKEATKVSQLLDLRVLGRFAAPAMPDVGGFNLTYARAGAMVAYQTADRHKAPVVAFWQKGLGRAMAVTFEADGSATGPVGGWAEYSNFFITVGRWLLGQGEPDGVRVRLHRRGGRGVVRMEIDPERVAAAALSPTANLLGPGPDGTPATARLPMRWISDSEAEAEFDLDQAGTYQAVVGLGDRVLRSGAMCLPYSPEFAPRTGQTPGRQTLAAIAAVSGGRSRLNMDGIFESPARRKTWTSIRPLLLWLAVLLTVAEIAGRRMSLWNANLVREPALAVRRMIAAARLPQPIGRFIRSLRRRRPDSPPASGELLRPASLASSPQNQGGTTPPQPPEPATPQTGDALNRAKKKARRDFKR